MPNHVTNILKAPAVVIAALKVGDVLVDFNALIPMPVELRDVSVNGDDRLVELLNGKLSLNPHQDDVLGRLTLSNTLRLLSDGGIEKWEFTRFENFVTMLRGYREHGAMSWYDFGYKKWGTKWNAYDITEIRGGVQFDTAWAAPHPVIAALAAKFPAEKIEHRWADEDIGHNCGRRIYQAGEVRETKVSDPVDFALTVTGFPREFYRKNAVTGKWEYDDSKD